MKKGTVQFFNECIGFGSSQAGLAWFQTTGKIISHGSGNYVTNEWSINQKTGETLC